jgi:hypothetical protein
MYPDIKQPMATFIVLLDIAMKPKCQIKFREPAILLFFILHYMTGLLIKMSVFF